MRSVLFEIFPAALLVAEEVFIAGFALGWVALAPFLDLATAREGALGIGLAVGIAASAFFSRHALRVAAGAD